MTAAKGFEAAKGSGTAAGKRRTYSGATVAPVLVVAKVEAKSRFEGGATRSQQSERFDLIPPAAVRAMARRLTLGAAKHGERNWESGGESFRQATMSHLMEHLLRYMEAPNQEDADALICNAAFLCHFEAKKATPCP